MTETGAIPRDCYMQPFYVNLIQTRLRLVGLLESVSGEVVLEDTSVV